MYDGQGRTVRPKMAEIKAVVARYNGLTVADLESSCRKRNFAWPRQIAAYLCREMTQCSYPEIGRAFGDRDHTTVLFSFRKIARLRSESAELEATLETYRADIRSVAEARMAAEDAVRIFPAAIPDKEFVRMESAKRRYWARQRNSRVSAAIDNAAWMGLGGELEGAT
jgi:hypothetical protein